MRLKTNPYSVPQAYYIEVSDHKIIDGKNPTTVDGEEVPGVPGNISSDVTRYGIEGRVLYSSREVLTPEQYAAWDATVFADDEYFTRCHLENGGGTEDTEDA